MKQRILIVPQTVCVAGSVIAMKHEMGGVHSTNSLQWALDFVEYMKDLTTGSRKVMLFMINIVHISLAVSLILKWSSVIKHALLLNTLGKTKPLDVVVFYAFKSALRTKETDCMLLYDNRTSDVYSNYSLLRRAFDSAFDTLTSRQVFVGLRCTLLTRIVCRICSVLSMMKTRKFS